MEEIIMQLHGGGGGGGGGTQIKQNAPGSQSAATIDSATEGQRELLREKLGKARGRNFTNKTGGSMVDTIKKALLGE
jgi:hypothetical protein|nr:MAG TPA: hypothetical protein [Caudoviricetes sp.]